MKNVSHRVLLVNQAWSTLSSAQRAQGSILEAPEALVEGSPAEGNLNKPCLRPPGLKACLRSTFMHLVHLLKLLL